MSAREEHLAEGLALNSGAGGNSQNVPLTSAAGAGGRRAAITRVNLPAIAARAWRVTLGAPVALSIPTSTYTAAPPTGFPDRWPNVDLTRASVVCNLIWGVGGAKFEAWLDWRNGCSFVVHGSHVDVGVAVAAGANVPGAPTAIGQLNYSAMITPDDAPSPFAAPPSLTFDTGSIAASSSASCPIPPFARSVRLHRYIGTTQSYEVRAFGDGGLTLLHGFLVYAAGNDRRFGDVTQQQFLPPNARWLEIQNLDGAVAIGFLVEFELDLG